MDLQRFDATTKEGREEFEKLFTEVTFKIFKKLHVGDIVYSSLNTWFMYYPYRVTSVRWRNSKDIDVMDKRGKFFMYKEIVLDCVGGCVDTRYADSCGHNYGRLYVKKA